MGFSLIKYNTSIDFMRLRYYACALSLALLLAGVLFIGLGNGLKRGIVFSGGVVVQLQCERSVEVDALN